MDMAYHFETLHNFRALRKSADSRSLIYRSARQEKISQEETKVIICNKVGYNHMRFFNVANKIYLLGIFES